MGAEGTILWFFSLKKFKNVVRISLEVIENGKVLLNLSLQSKQFLYLFVL